MVVVVIGNGCTGSGCHLTSWVYGDEPCKMDTLASMKHIVMVALNVVFLLSTRNVIHVVEIYSEEKHNMYFYLLIK